MSMDWLEPQNLQETFAALGEYGEDARLVAGGTWVTLVLKGGFLFPSALIALSRVPGLNGIRFDPSTGLTLGAMVRHRKIETDPIIRRHFPMLAETFGTVANVRIRNQATIGGCLCDADYASDPPAMLIALDAQVHLQTAESDRWLLVEDFITGHYQTALEPGELLTEVCLPVLPAGSRGVYLKYRSRSHEDRPCVGIAILMETAEGVVSNLRVVVGAVAERPQRVPDAEALALGKPMTEALARQIAAAYAEVIDPLDDIRGSGWYRRQMIRVLVQRAILRTYG